MRARTNLTSTFNLGLFTLLFVCIAIPTSNLKSQAKSCNTGLENLRFGFEMQHQERFPGFSDFETSSMRLSDLTLHSELMLFSKHLTLGTGIGIQKSNITLSEHDATTVLKANSSETETTFGGDLIDNRVYVNIPVGFKVRSGLIANNIKFYAGGGLNNYHLIQQNASLNFVKDGMTVDQPKVIEREDPKYKRSLYSNIGFEWSLSCNLILQTGLVYTRSLTSAYTESNFKTENLGLEVGFFF